MPNLIAYAIVKLELVENGSTTEQDMIDDASTNCDYSISHNGSDSKIVATELLEVTLIRPATTV